MKLIVCLECADVFQLRVSDMRYCDCGACSGMYNADRTTAVVSGPAISLAIGNGSLINAIYKLKQSGMDKDRDWYIDECKVTHCWVRPNSGPGNPHTTEI